MLNTRLAHYLAEALAGSPGVSGEVGGSLSDVSAIAALPEEAKATVLTSFVHSLHDMFLVAVPFLAVAVLIAFLIPEVPLRTRQMGLDEAAGEPSPAALAG